MSVSHPLGTISELSTGESTGAIQLDQIVLNENLSSPSNSGADTQAINAATTHAAALAALNAQTTGARELTQTEQDSLHHTLYASTAAAGNLTTSTLFTPTTSGTRIGLSVRANDLLSPAWFSEATTLVALFALDTRSDSSVSSVGQYQFLAQTEYVQDTNAPVFKTQFVLERNNKKQNYMVRVYDVENNSDVIEEGSYLGLAIFNLEELLQNCRQNASSGGFVSVVLPLINPVNNELNEQLTTSQATVTLSLQLPQDSTTTVTSSSLSQSIHEYTRLINYVAPNILANNMDLNLSLIGGSANSNLISVWYRTRSTALFQLMGFTYVQAGIAHTFVISNELFLSESAGSTDIDAVEAGFEVKFVVHDSKELPVHALSTKRNVEKYLGGRVNTLASVKDGAPASLSKPDASYIGSTSLTFKQLLLSLDLSSGLSLPLSESPLIKVNLTLKSRPSIPESTNDSDASDASSSTALTLPSLPSSIPASVLTKAHDLLRAGLYFTQYTNGGGQQDIFLQLIDGDREGLGQPTRLSWKNAQAAATNGLASSEVQSIPLSTIQHIYGGRDSSDAFTAQIAAGKSLPSNDTLFSILSTASNLSLSLEASSWQTRDTFIFSILSYQAQLGLPVALWHPIGAGATSGATPKIVPAEKPAVSTLVKSPSLGGSHGSLARSPTSNAPKSGMNNDVDLGEVLSKLEKLFEAGRNFIRFTSGSHKPFYISLFLRKDNKLTSNGKPVFYLYWCRADQRTLSPTRSLRSDEILGIALGKQTSVFKKDECALAPAGHCFSIIGVNRSLHLQSWNERDSDTYSFGIASLIKHYGPKPKLWQAGQYTESISRLEIENATEMQEENDGTAQVDPSDIPALANAQGYKCAIELSVKCKNLPSKFNNHIVCVFDRDETTEKLTYLAQTEKQNRASNPEFRKTFRLTYDSTVLRKLRFNVYDLDSSKKQMDDEDRLGSAMMLLKEVVDGQNIEFVYKLTHENPTKQAALLKGGATIIVTCTSKSEMSLDMNNGK